MVQHWQRCGGTKKEHIRWCSTAAADALHFGPCLLEQWLQVPTPVMGRRSVRSGGHGLRCPWAGRSSGAGVGVQVKVQLFPSEEAARRAVPGRRQRVSSSLEERAAWTMDRGGKQSRREELPERRDFTRNLARATASASLPRGDGISAFQKEQSGVSVKLLGGSRRKENRQMQPPQLKNFCA